MRKILLLGLILTLLGAGQAFGSLWTYYDFGDPFNYHNNWSPIEYPFIGNLPAPGMFGGGGEGSDLEGGFAAADENYLYFGLANSFGLESYSSDNNKFYELGSLFFGFNGANTQYAIHDFTGSRAYDLVEVSSYDLIPLESAAWGSSIRLACGAYTPTGGAVLGGVDFNMTMYADLEDNPLYPVDNGDTWLLEVRVAKSLFAGVDFSTIEMVSIHQTLACGNDLIEDSFDIPSGIPEPGTLLLLGVGLLGTGVARHYRRK